MTRDALKGARSFFAGNIGPWLLIYTSHGL